jgi:hypothetical protein
MIKLTEQREIAPYVWVHPGGGAVIQEGGDHLPKFFKAQRRLRNYDRRTPVLVTEPLKCPARGLSPLCRGSAKWHCRIFP